MNLTKDELKAARMGEFQELAWELQFEVEPELTDIQKQSLLDRLASFAELNQLGLAGKFGDGLAKNSCECYVVSLLNRKAVTIVEQALLNQWLMTQTGVNLVAESEGDGLTDAWFAWTVVYAGSTENQAFAKFFS